MEHNTIRPKY